MKLSESYCFDEAPEASIGAVNDERELCGVINSCKRLLRVDRQLQTVALHCTDE